MSDDIAAGMNTVTGSRPASGRFATHEALQEFYGPAADVGLRAHLTYIHEHYATFIRRSPFVVVGTSDVDGMPCVSPKGDAPGFATVIDQHTILLPDRPGNNQINGLHNLLDNPKISLLFMIPGIRETLRVKGLASIIADADVAASCTARGKLPPVVLEIEVTDIYIHCGKALIRSSLWNPETRVERNEVPTIGKMFADQNSDLPISAAEGDALAERVYLETLY
ncbi:MSMEG_1061 family FMN-dependent PPOX-type flavoprotein [Streptomyces sp. ME19-01-6]|uniref:MSMEG_1061 family FMN-dependent PPOX-type flavoprotein n=1 Tax=Streptomyces sp. ME19-01-6 TaxID=3028686 RepID=UPI0029B5FB5C|nr:MSMEG_1061 family FMN-dependent PPOX-type flavoprotein [Streptomyces sp. ME19-01-6]MDX3233922.1 pyridoxamine 5'-phosphate oxidase family protein [Streptomyces sp. ME19-01-6]